MNLGSINLSKFAKKRSVATHRIRCQGPRLSVGTPVVDLLLKLEFWNESKTCKFPTQNISGILEPWPWEDL